MLKSLSIRHRGVKIISCPSCARQGFDVIRTVATLEDRLAHIETPVTLSIIGCVVNGPGEALMTDIGLTGGGAGTAHGLCRGQDRPHHRRGRRWWTTWSRWSRRKAAPIQAAEAAEAGGKAEAAKQAAESAAERLRHLGAAARGMRRHKVPGLDEDIGRRDAALRRLAVMLGSQLRCSWR